MVTIAKFSKRCVYKQIPFDSETERDYYIYLETLKEQSKIKDFRIQVPFLLQDEFLDFEYNKIPKMEYVLDFEITLNNNDIIYIDVKGDIEESAQIKRKLFMYKYNDLPIYFVAITPKYLGHRWVEVSKGKDFRSKLSNKYKSIYGKWVRNKTPNWTIDDWLEYFTFENIHDLFFKWISTKKKQPKKK